MGTGSWIWAKEVAKKYAEAMVVGVVLNPPPGAWVPANCRFEVDDVMRAWGYGGEVFELLHLR